MSERWFYKGVRDGKLDVVDLGISLGVDINAHFEDGVLLPAIIIAANKGHTSIVSRLIESGANVDFQIGLHDPFLEHAESPESPMDISGGLSVKPGRLSELPTNTIKTGEYAGK